MRSRLLELWREARRDKEPVGAWAWIVENPERARSYKTRRGRGGFVRARGEEVSELIAAANVYTIQRFGPDRIAGFSPIPAMSQVKSSPSTRNELNAAVTLLRAMRLVLVLRHRFCDRAALRRSLGVQHQSAESRPTRNRRAPAKEAPAGRIECLAGHLLSLRPRQLDTVGRPRAAKGTLPTSHNYCRRVIIGLLRFRAARYAGGTCGAGAPCARSMTGLPPWPYPSRRELHHKAR